MGFRSYVLTALAVVSSLTFGLAGVVAQDATPGGAPVSDLRLQDSAGLPEIAVTVTDAGFEGIPPQLDAGRYIITLTNNASGPIAITFVQLPEGRTGQDLAILAGPPPGEGAEGAGAEGTPGIASPEAGLAGASPEAGMDMGSPPAGEDPTAWLYQTYFSGGPSAAPGQTAQGIVDLAAGNYAAHNDAGQPFIPFEFTVTGASAASPAAGAAPTTSAVVTEVKTADGFAFEVSGLTTGPQTIQIVNDSDQPHFMEMIYSPVPITVDQVFALFSLEPGATPAPESGLPNPQELVQAVYASTQSAGSTQYIAADLQPGYYVVACFIPDPTNQFTPHAFEGMVQVVPVGVEGATPEASPAA